ncbi:MAG: iron-containing alcohol dehydrogenase [candidate division Zixibacteria bacterium]|nr:iron-containing alcohol dehydrogenase [candidate division Zixibacteria bacterium]
MENFILRMPAKMIFGPGEVAKVGEEASVYGNKVMLVTGKNSVRKTGLLDRVTKFLTDSRLEYVHFDRIEPNPRATTVDEAGKIAREENCELVLGVGGGSAMDASKAIAAVAHSGYPIWEHVYNDDRDRIRPIEDALPIILVPTLAATSSESNRGGVITNRETNEKVPFFAEPLFPKVSIIDPELTLTVGRETTIDGAMDIISHVIESYLTGPDNTPLQDRFTEGVIRTVIENLEKVLDNPGDIEARTNLSWCSTIALLGPVNLGRPGPFPLHSVEHVISGHYDISHGKGLAIMFPALMRLTYKDRLEKYASLAKNIFFVETGKMSLDEAGLEFIERFEAWMKKVGMFARLSEVGINAESFETMASDTIRVYGFGKDHIAGYKPLYKQDLMRMFELAK